MSARLRDRIRKLEKLAGRACPGPTVLVYPITTGDCWRAVAGGVAFEGQREACLRWARDRDPERVVIFSIPRPRREELKRE